KVWAELFSPLPAAVANPNVQQQDTQAIPMVMGAGATAYSPYLIQVANNNTDATYGPLLPAWDNGAGTPEQSRTRPTLGAFFSNAGNGSQTVTMGGQAVTTPPSITPGGTGYLLVGPKSPSSNPTPNPGDTRDNAIKARSTDATVANTQWF